MYNIHIYVYIYIYIYIYITLLEHTIPVLQSHFGNYTVFLCKLAGWFQHVSTMGIETFRAKMVSTQYVFFFVGDIWIRYWLVVGGSIKIGGRCGPKIHLFYLWWSLQIYSMIPESKHLNWDLIIWHFFGGYNLHTLVALWTMKIQTVGFRTSARSAPLKAGMVNFKTCCTHNGGWLYFFKWSFPQGMQF